MKAKILALTAALLLFGGIVSASGINGDYNGNPIVRVTANGSTITDDVPAQIIDNKTMIPLTMLRKLGVTVTWDQAAYSADVKLPKQHANVLSQAELDSVSRNVGLVSEYDDKGNNLGQASGFVLPNGYFVTNAHVWKGASALKVKIDGKDYSINKPLVVNDKTDIIIAKIDVNSSLKIAPDIPQMNDKVYAIGYPLGKYEVNVGQVYYDNYDYGVEEIIHSAKSAPGQSGGVLLNEFGEVVGVTAFTQAANYYGAIQIKHVQQELNKLK